MTNGGSERAALYGLTKGVSRKGQEWFAPGGEFFESDGILEGLECFAALQHTCGLEGAEENDLRGKFYGRLKVVVNRRRDLGNDSTSSDLRRGKIPMVKKAIMHGNYEIKAEDIANKNTQRFAPAIYRYSKSSYSRQAGEELVGKLIDR